MLRNPHVVCHVRRPDNLHVVTAKFHCSQTKSKDYYAILDLKKTASQEDVKKAFYRKAKEYHPDSNQGEQSAVKFQEISEAYEILGDVAKRRVFDSSIKKPYVAPQEPWRTDQWKCPSETKRAPSSESMKSKDKVAPDHMSMNHMKFVYKTLNKEEKLEEKPKFRPFEDHSYPNSQFNRFEYSRKYDPYRKGWVYVKRSTASHYQAEMARKAKILNTVIGWTVALTVMSWVYLQSL